MQFAEDWLGSVAPSQPARWPLSVVSEGLLSVPGALWLRWLPELRLLPHKSAEGNPNATMAKSRIHILNALLISTPIRSESRPDGVFPSLVGGAGVCLSLIHQMVADIPALSILFNAFDGSCHEFAVGWSHLCGDIQEMCLGV